MASGRILLVDDDTEVAASLKEVLQCQGYLVTAVESGEAALEQIAIQEFDLALIDLKMPGIGGMEVLTALHRQFPDTAIVVLTAHGSLETAIEAMRQGAHNYLLKPCRIDELLEGVREALSSRHKQLQQRELLAQVERSLVNLECIRTSIAEQIGSSASSPQVDERPGRFLQYKGVLVDLARHIVTLDDRPLELSPIEFELLTTLVSRAPHVVSAQELVRQAEGYESDPWEAGGIVRCHIYRIRKKLEAAAGRADVIRTVRGRGYTIGD